MSFRTFKKGVDADASRERRHKVTISLRNKKKNELMAKRYRGRGELKEAKELEQPVLPPLKTALLRFKAAEKEKTDNGLEKALLLLSAYDYDEEEGKAQGNVKAFASLVTEVTVSAVSIWDGAEYKEKEGLRKTALLFLLTLSNHSATSLCLHNAKGTETALRVFLKTADERERIDCIDLVSNVIADGDENVLATLTKHGVLQQIIGRLEKGLRHDLVLAESVIHLLSNYVHVVECDREIVWSKPVMQTVLAMMPMLAWALNSENKEVCESGIWTIKYITVGSTSADLETTDKEITIVFSGNKAIIPSVLALAESEHEVIREGAMTVLSNLCSSTDEVTQWVIDEGLFRVLPRLLNHLNRRVRADAAMIAGNLAAGPPLHFHPLLEKALYNCITTLRDDEREMINPVQQQVSWIAYNLVLETKRRLVLPDERKWFHYYCERISAGKDLVPSTGFCCLILQRGDTETKRWCVEELEKTRCLERIEEFRDEDGQNPDELGGAQRLVLAYTATVDLLDLGQAPEAIREVRYGMASFEGKEGYDGGW